MSVKTPLKLSDILATFNKSSKIASEEVNDRIDDQEVAEEKEDEKAEESEASSDANADADSDAETDGASDGDEKTASESVGDVLMKIANDAAEEHTAALKKEAQLFGEAFADSVLQRLYEVAEHQKLAALYDDTYAYTMQKIAESMMPAQVVSPAAAQIPVAAATQQVVDPNYGLVYPTPDAAPNLPGYVEAPTPVAPGVEAAEAVAPVEPEALVEEALYPESLPAEATAPEAPVEEAPAPEANPTVEAVAEAITSSADAAAEASRAAALLTEALAPAQPEEAPAAEPELTDEELAQYSQAAYDEALKALQIQQ